MEVGGQVFVNDGARRGEKNFNPAGVVPEDHPVSADAQAVKAFQLLIEGLGVAGGQRGQGQLDPPARLGGEAAKIVADLRGDDDLRLQWRRADET